MNLLTKKELVEIKELCITSTLISKETYMKLNCMVVNYRDEECPCCYQKIEEKE